MAQNARNQLFDKDIRALEPKESKYRKVVGNPKELYLIVYPTGIKTFCLKQNNSFTKIKNFREGIYSVAEARRDAMSMLKVLESGGELDSSKYLFKNLVALYIKQKHTQGLSEDYIKRVESVISLHLGNFFDRDIRHIKRTDLLEALREVFNPQEPNTSRLETIKRLGIYLNGVFDIAIKDRYLDYNPAYKIANEFPNKAKFYAKNDIDSRLSAITSDELLSEFLSDLKANTTLDIQTKRAIYLQILCMNRPINTASAKWSHIDLDSALWVIPAKEMKTQAPHTIALNSYALGILQRQKSEFSGINDSFVFPALNSSGHINRDTLSKALRTFEKGKYRGKTTTHGFRATFRTICSLHKAELLQKGISDEVIESALAHKTDNEIKFAYEREKATLEQKRILMQWYGDYLHNLCAFEI